MSEITLETYGDKCVRMNRVSDNDKNLCKLIKGIRPKLCEIPRRISLSNGT